MNHVERLNAVMNFEPVDRLPMIEWAGYWNLTRERWYTEGLPEDLVAAKDVRAHLGLDPWWQQWFHPRGPECPQAPYHGAGIMKTEAEYEALLPHLYPEHIGAIDKVREWAPAVERGEAVFWISFDGFFWFPRTLFGIEAHLYAFSDCPELMHRMSRDLLAFNLRVLDAVCDVCTPRFMTFGEDMSYNHGPMLSKAMFDEFLAPYYRQIVPEVKRRGIVPMVDSDGHAHVLIDWLAEVGIEGLLPYERRAGNDLAAIRARHPRWLMIGGFDKTIMKDGEAAIREEFERLLPVMRSGGCIPAVDHQTPPDVSLDTYRTYVRLLREYCEKAVAP